MARTYYTWKQIEAMVKDGRLTSRQKKKIFQGEPGKLGLIKQRRFRMESGGLNKVSVDKLGKVFDELLGHVGATGIQKSYFKHLSRPEVLRKKVFSSSHGADASKKAQQASLPSRHNIGPGHSTDVIRMREEGEARRNLSARHRAEATRSHGPRPVRPSHHAPPFMPHRTNY